MNECESDEGMSVKDRIIMWCEGNGRYDIVGRIQLIPEEEPIFKKLLFESPDSALKILDAEGY